MKNILKLIVGAGLLLAMSSCSKEMQTDRYNPDSESPEAAYFTTNKISQAFPKDSDSETIYLTLHRQNNKGKAFIQMEFATASDSKEFFEFPADMVEFEDGAYEATLPVVVKNIGDFAMGITYQAAAYIDGEEEDSDLAASLKKYTEIIINVSVELQWETMYVMKDPSNLLNYDNLTAADFKLDDFGELIPITGEYYDMFGNGVEVQIQRAVGTNLFRIPNFQANDDSDVVDQLMWSIEPDYPKHVIDGDEYYHVSLGLGYMLNYGGDDIWGSDTMNTPLSERNFPGDLYEDYPCIWDGENTFIFTTVFIVVEDGQIAGWYGAPSGWTMEIDLITGEITYDYSVKTTLTGFYTDLQFNHSAIVDVKAGKDVEEVEIAVIEGENPQALLNAMLAGTVETQKINASDTVHVPLSGEDDTYTIMAISYANGEPEDYDYITFYYAAGEDTRSPLDMTWTIDDMYGIEKDDLFNTKWVLYATDFFEGEHGVREPWNYITFAESDQDYVDDYGYDIDAIEIKGLTGLNGDDTILFEYYEGVILNLVPYNMGQVSTGSASFYLNYEVLAATDITYGMPYGLYDEMLLGGVVKDGYIAFTYSGWYGDLGSDPEPNGLLFRGYTDEACATKAAANFFGYYDIMLEPQGAVGAQLSRKSTTSVSELNLISREFAKVPTNYVELRGRERAHAIIREIKSRKPAEAKVETYKVLSTGSAKVAKESKKVEASMPILRSLE